MTGSPVPHPEPARWRGSVVPPGPRDPERPLPPGQRVARDWPVLHYGPVPRFRPATWDFRVFGVLGDEVRWTWQQWRSLPRTSVLADFHCVTKFTVPANHWGGVAARTILELAPPAPAVTHVMVWAEYGYSANLRLADFADAATIFATERNGEPLTPDHGAPLRLVVPTLYGWKGPKWARAVEYLTADRRGFWEERGYHNIADPWREQRYSYQEETGDGPSPVAG